MCKNSPTKRYLLNNTEKHLAPSTQANDACHVLYICRDRQLRRREKSIYTHLNFDCRLSPALKREFENTKAHSVLKRFILWHSIMHESIEHSRTGTVSEENICLPRKGNFIVFLSRLFYSIFAQVGLLFWLKLNIVISNRQVLQRNRCCLAPREVDDRNKHVLIFQPAAVSDKLWQLEVSWMIHMLPTPAFFSAGCWNDVSYFRCWKPVHSIYKWLTRLWFQTRLWNHALDHGTHVM